MSSQDLLEQVRGEVSASVLESDIVEPQGIDLSSTDISRANTALSHDELPTPSSTDILSALDAPSIAPNLQVYAELFNSLGVGLGKTIGVDGGLLAEGLNKAFSDGIRLSGLTSDTPSGESAKLFEQEIESFVGLVGLYDKEGGHE